MTFQAFLALVLLISTSACSRNEVRYYENLAELGGTGDAFIVAQLAVPDDATSIQVTRGAGTDLFHISYLTTDPQYARLAKDMLRIDTEARDRAVRTLGYGASIPADAALHAWCRDDWRAGPPQAFVAKELLFLADAKGRQFQWNTFHGRELTSDVCR